MKEGKQSFNDVAFVGTYECNTDCEYCFSTKYIDPYKKITLSFERYKEILDVITKNGVDSIAFIGGEPALWQQLSPAIAYAKTKGVKTTVFSNALIPIKETPDVLYVHLNVLFFLKNKNIIRNLYNYARHAKIVFIYNIYKPTPHSLALLKKLLLGFRFDFAFCFNIAFHPQMDTSYGDFFYEAYHYITQNLGKNVLASGPLPHCIFSDPQRIFFQEQGIIDTHIGPAGFDSTDVFFTVVNPDGKTLLPCAPIHVHSDIGYLLENDYQGYAQKYSQAFAKPLQQTNSFCQNCEKFNQQCQYGGIINLYSLPETHI